MRFTSDNQRKAVWAAMQLQRGRLFGPHTRSLAKQRMAVMSQHVAQQLRAAERYGFYAEPVKALKYSKVRAGWGDLVNRKMHDKVQKRDILQAINYSKPFKGVDDMSGESFTITRPIGYLSIPYKKPQNLTRAQYSAILHELGHAKDILRAGKSPLGVRSPYGFDYDSNNVLSSEVRAWKNAYKSSVVPLSRSTLKTSIGFYTQRQKRKLSSSRIIEAILKQGKMQ